MNNNLVSIIVPIYNVSNYLHRCISSVLEQTYSNLELVLVNDGSTDGSKEICESFDQKYSNVTVINKQNGGLSDARNVGVCEAQGDLIFYLDGDDWLDKNCIAKLVETFVLYDADIVQCNHYYSYSGYGFYNCKGFERKDWLLLDREQAIERLLYNQELKNFAWGKLMKASVAKQCLFPIGKLYEDTFWTHSILHLNRRTVLLKEPLLFYRQREGSISYSKFDYRSLHRLEGQLIRNSFIQKYYPDLTNLSRRNCLFVFAELSISARSDHSVTSQRRLLHHFRSFLPFSSSSFCWLLIQILMIIYQFRSLRLAIINKLSPSRHYQYNYDSNLFC